MAEAPSASNWSEAAVINQYVPYGQVSEAPKAAVEAKPVAAAPKVEEKKIETKIEKTAPVAAVAKKVAEEPYPNPVPEPTAAPSKEGGPKDYVHDDDGIQERKLDLFSISRILVLYYYSVIKLSHLYRVMDGARCGVDRK